MGVGQINTSPGSPTGRTHGVFVQNSPGNPDFLGSHSFGAVNAAGLIGTTTRSQAVTISDVRGGAGSGVYNLSSSAVRNVPEGVSVSFSNANGEAISQVEVPANGWASFNVNLSINGEAVPVNATQIEFYVTASRNDGGQTLRMPFQLRATRPTVAGAVAPVMGSIQGNELAGNPPTDIDGSYRLSFSYSGSPAPAKIRIQESTNNGATWATLADVPGTQTSFDISGRGNGSYQYRTVGLFTVEGGLIDGPASAVRSVNVDRRIAADVTSLIQASLVSGTVVFANGIFEFDQNLKNVSETGVYAPLTFTITSITSGSGTVRVQNADNGGNGVSSHATFDYSAQVGSDQLLAPGETSGVRRLKFTNSAAEMFQFTAVITGHFPDTANAGGTSGSAGGSSGGDSTGGGTGGTTGNSSGTLPLSGVTLKFLVNPLTNSVSISVLSN
jgi:hypothetical protein